MFFKIFSKKSTQNKDNKHPVQDAMLHAMEQQEKTDPLIRPKIISKEITHRLTNSMKTEKGVHVESLLAVLSALGGFACQMAVREGFIKTGQLPANALMEIKCHNGDLYYMGKILNKVIFEDQYSLYSLAGGGMIEAGGTKNPDIHEISNYVAGTLGKEEFGIPRFPDGHKCSDLPINYVKDLWLAFMPLLLQYKLSPLHWPIAFSLSIQQVIIDGKAVLNPELAFQMVMEVAVPMSAINPALVYGSSNYSH